MERGFVVSRTKALLAAMVIYAALALPLGAGYSAAARVVGARSTADAMSGSAHVTDYLAAPQRSLLYGELTNHRGGDERRLFPGLALVILAAIGLRGRRTAEQVAYLIALVVAVDVSLGMNGMTFRLLWNNVDVFRAIRIPARMGLLVGLALSVLAAHGVRNLRQGVRGAWARALIPAVACGLIVIESTVRTPALLAETDTIPPAYADLMRDAQGTPTAVVADLPIAAGMPADMYYSTFHWQNLLTGYSGFYPPSFVELERALTNFPDPPAIEMLRRRQARYVIVHGEVYTPAEYASIVASADRSRDLALVSRTPWRGAEISVYRMLPGREGT
jgi:hypothetical protein